MRKVMFAAALMLFAVLASSDFADAARIRCGSSWEICAQRGKGPGSKFDPNKTTRGNQRQIREGFDRPQEPRR